MRPESGMVFAIAGATGAVGREMLRELEESDLPVAGLRLLASERSAGSKLRFRSTEVEVEPLRPEAFAGVQVALFSAGAERSLLFAPCAVEHGAVVIDNSSAFRMDPRVPLVVPEVNPAECERHQGIIANPNCSTIQLVLPVKVLVDAVGVERLVVSTYQSASGAGQSGIEELLLETRRFLDGESPRARIFAHPLPFEVVPQIGEFSSSGFSQEEIKMIQETRKILGLPDLQVAATCVRVPVIRGHSESVTVDLEREIAVEEVRRRFASMPGLVVQDEPARNNYPLARVAQGRRETFVGRIRKDLDRARTLHFWVVSDNLLKGAATNAVQIAQQLACRRLVRSLATDPR
ncbi:MAG: aspartate-semialdehyde dehydrogenase [Bradymonadales bacterium]|nr:aspartate-semialdehyde dehydrogenase [Bradymonadales bacterium]